jgi:hypothetical protein
MVSNPPYLARNKAKGQYAPIYDKFKQSDLYKCHLAGLNCNEGIVILPSNFLSESNSSARKMFFSRFSILQAEYWTEQVFPEATTGIVIFHYKWEKNPIQHFPLTMLPEEKKIDVVLKPEYGYLFGAEFFQRISQYPKTVTVEKGTKGIPPNTRLVLSLLDKNKIPQGLSINTGDPILSTKTAFTTYQLVVHGVTLSQEEEEKIVSSFNSLMGHYRKKYSGLFLTNYMGANQKILPVSYCYRLINYIVNEFRLGGVMTVPKMF